MCVAILLCFILFYVFAGYAEAIQIPSGKVMPRLKAIGRSLARGIKAEGNFIFVSYLEILEMYVEDIECTFSLEDGHVMVFSRIKGSFYGGTLSGNVRVSLDEDVSYRVELEFQNVDFGWFAMNVYDPGENFRGKVNGSLKISGNDEGDVHGNLNLELKNGYLLKLPRWFTTFTLVNMNPMRSNVISDASADVTIGSKGFTIRRIEMSTNDVDIYGTGTISYDGDADIVFNPVGKHKLLKGTLILMPVAVFWQMLEKGIWRIHLKGPIFSLKYRISPLYRL